MQITAFVVVLLVACAVARPEAPLLRPGLIPVLSRSEVRDEAGQYALSYLTGNGISVTDQGALKRTADGKDYVLVQQGSYSYTAPDGTPITITYTADENGFRPEGKHLPVSVVA